MTRNFDQFCSKFLFESSRNSWNPERFMRVVPRDLFNEAKILSMVSKFAKDVNQGKMPGGFIGKLNKKWTVALSEGGALYISGFNLTYKGQKADLTMNYNAGKEHRFPLQITVENMDLYSASIYDENGELESDMKQFEEAPGPGKIDIPDWSSTIEELKRLGKIGLNDNSGLMPKDDSRGFADSFSNGKINNIKVNKNITENFDQFCSRFLYESVSDDEYLMAVDADDMETAQKMVDEAAQRAGYSAEGFHGTHRDFTVFNRRFALKDRIGLKLDTVGSWFTDSSNVAKLLYGPKVMRSYLSLRKPLVFDGIGGLQNLRDEVSEAHGDVETFREWAKSKGYDGVEISGDFVDGELQTIRIVFDPNQIKSADPVTRDDHGNIIPLSQRFDSSKDDIRY